MANRVFKSAVYVTIDKDEAPENEDGSQRGPVTLEELKDYVGRAVFPTLNDEEHGNPVGLIAVELDWENLVEVPRN